MKSKVYFIKVGNADSVEVVRQKLGRLLSESRLLTAVKAQDQVVMKLHFGEEGNTGYVKPEYIELIAREVMARRGLPVIADTNTLYRGQRTNSADHIALAARHGFTEEATGALIVVPENTNTNNISVALNQQYVQTARVVRLFLDADVLIGVAHFKGHLMTGFGGALKNIGMGCASREGKLAQHSDVSPVVAEGLCVGCGACAAVCPVDAISLSAEKAGVDGKLCIGCASCIAACSYGAMSVAWESGGESIQQKMVEYTKAVLEHRKGPSLFLNFAVKITKECDCLAQDDPRICPDIGLFASVDPVSIDRACYDKAVAACGRDIFRDAHPARDGMQQLEYAAKLGVGRLEYDCIEIG